MSSVFSYHSLVVGHAQTQTESSTGPPWVGFSVKQVATRSPIANCNLYLQPLSGTRTGITVQPEELEAPVEPPTPSPRIVKTIKIATYCAILCIFNDLAASQSLGPVSTSLTN